MEEEMEDFFQYLDRGFRQKIFDLWKRGPSFKPLDESDRQLHRILMDHPEFEYFWENPQKYLDYDFDPQKDPINPFLHVIIHQVVDSQVTKDEPKGIRRVYLQMKRQNLPLHEIQHRIGSVFLYFLFPVLQNRVPFDTKGYLEELNRVAADPAYYDQRYGFQGREPLEEWEEEESPFFIAEVEQLMSAFEQRLREEQDKKMISVNSKLQTALNKCPAHWVEAIHKNLDLPRRSRNKERVKDICSYYARSEGVKKAVKELIEDEIEALKLTLQKGGWVKYGELSRRFGDENEDSWWWADEPPESVIGRLRSFGLLFVGRAPVKSRLYKVAVIPVELREPLSSLLLGSGA